MGIIIRQITEDQLDAITPLRLQLASFLQTINPDRLPHPNPRLEDWYKKIVAQTLHKNEGALFAAQVEEKIVGFVYGVVHMPTEDEQREFTYQKTGEVVDLFVLDEFRGKRMAVKLICAIEEYFRKSGCASMTVNTLVNNPALTFYENVGFTHRDITLAKYLK